MIPLIWVDFETRLCIMCVTVNLSSHTRGVRFL